ncbi:MULTISPECIES: hypothetical protein [unclassified Streptomyces]|uniref:hypothetical protein n=1 Tax=unclassified Streptomyces TaxID=2593676 RepID=UPI00116143A6|nr:hypothetical protein [Streptomyces sp. TSRI0281]
MRADVVEGGVDTCSLATAEMPCEGTGAYTVATARTRPLGPESARDGIRCGALRPGPTNTPAPRPGVGRTGTAVHG